MSDKLTIRVAKLLAQADNAGTEEEAATFMAKAQEVATLHSIDLAKARHATRDKQRTTPVQRVIELGVRGTRGLNTLVDLISGIATANDVKINIRNDSTAVIAFGFAEDIDVTEAMYASLVVQMATAADQWKKQGDWKGEQVYVPGRWGTGSRWGEWIDGRYKPVTWLTARLDFQLGYAHRVGDRLADAKQAAVDAAEADDVGDTDSGPGAGTSLVLVEKEKSVEDFYRRTSRARGSYRGHRGAVSYASTEAGDAAGQRARLSQATGIGGARRAVSA
ncbi:DUF2786 domain-containing protein [Mycolicibacillus koreensis]|uniref:DUF2786 domain-containing protein n=1 Tax=Mycolicibacillus koreensis TaxID=1069220 RepID=A0A7I7SCC8_9MYCO|nr:DUF2786 domain-containing protein [Mycolicibacillus koreensis]OSC30615.1 hypothetical protein B8W67_16905 [Mycolicibacillus koreensis]BBY54041.1 hypothetical protein MKOR_12920 [Mycolicibacillus koreensis]